MKTLHRIFRWLFAAFYTVALLGAVPAAQAGVYEPQRFHFSAKLGFGLNASESMSVPGAGSRFGVSMCADYQVAPALDVGGEVVYKRTNISVFEDPDNPDKVTHQQVANLVGIFAEACIAPDVGAGNIRPYAKVGFGVGMSTARDTTTTTELQRYGVRPAWTAAGGLRVSHILVEVQLIHVLSNRYQTDALVNFGVRF